jgi:predicted aspartyl protease
MGHRSFWTLIVILGIAAGHSLAWGSHESEQSDQNTVRFDLYREYLIVARGAAGPLKGLNFLIDTGASPTILDPRLARKLHLEQHPARIAVLVGDVSAGQAIVPSLDFGPIQKNNLTVFVEDLSFLEKALPVRIDAIIGLDVLGQSPFVIDYTLRTIHFGRPSPFPISVPLRMKAGLAIVEAEVDHVPISMVVDTGASSLIIFDSRPPRSEIRMNVSASPRSTKSIGDFERKEIKLHSLKFGDAELGREPAFVVQNHRDPGRDFDGLMSPAAMGITRVSIDLERGVLAFSR